VSLTTVVAVAAVAAVAAVGAWWQRQPAAVVGALDNKDRWRWRLMAAAALDGGHATTSQRSERVAQQEDKRMVQGEAT
jgi:hypothetical protein